MTPVIVIDDNINTHMNLVDSTPVRSHTHTTYTWLQLAAAATATTRHLLALFTSLRLSLTVESIGFVILGLSLNLVPSNWQ
jgi:hypothetical protein